MHKSLKYQNNSNFSAKKYNLTGLLLLRKLSVEISIHSIYSDTFRVPNFNVLLRILL